MLPRLRHRSAIVALLVLIACPALILGWVYRHELGLSVSTAGSTEPTEPEPRSLQMVSLPGAFGLTDTGRAIPLQRWQLKLEDRAELRRREQRSVENGALHLIRITGADETYNCFGWMFAGGGYWVASTEVLNILRDNGYEPVSEPRTDDVIIYYSPEGRIIHGGLVRAAPAGGPILIESKWAELGRYVHKPDDSQYGRNYSFFRTARPDHRLKAIPDPSARGTIMAN